jgi:hypothetical protein
MSTARAEANKKLALGLVFGLGLTSHLLLSFAVVYRNKYKLMGQEMKRLEAEYAVETAVPSETINVIAKDDDIKYIYDNIMTKKKKIMNGKVKCDVCIIGAGPASLATLSAIREPYSLDSLSRTQANNANRGMSLRHGGDRRAGGGGGGKKKKVCIVDPNDGWLGSWRDNFAR